MIQAVQFLVSSLLSFRNSGFIRSIGINTHDTAVMNAIIGSPLGSITNSIMLDFNILQQDRVSLISTFEKAGISVWAGTALCQGFLSQSLLQMLLRTRSLSYLARALFNPSTRDLRAKSSEVRPILQQFPSYYDQSSLPVMRHGSIHEVPIGMLSKSSIVKNYR